MLSTHLILGLLWIFFCALHSILASLSVKKKVQKRFPQTYRYYRLFYTVFAAVTLIGVIYFQLSIPSPNLFEPGKFSAFAGAATTGAGLVVMGICIRKYFMSLSGVKSLFKDTPSSELMIAGIHRIIRHPLYLGTFLFIWGLWLLFPGASLFIANVVITVYTVWAIRWEEEKLVAEFGDAYRVYQQTVPKLIPKFS